MQFLNDPFCTSLLTINIQKCLAYFLLPRIPTLLYNTSKVNISTQTTQDYKINHVKMKSKSKKGKFFFLIIEHTI